MKILSIEPTPSPNSMKLNLDEKLPNGVNMTYTQEHKGTCPDYIEQLLTIQNVKSVFRVADFMALERKPKGDWKQILAEAREILGEGLPEASAANAKKGTQSPAEQGGLDEAFGEVSVWVQTFRGLPIQVRVRAGTEEERVALPERFGEAVLKAQSSSPNMIMERKLEEKGVRYGDLREIAEQVVQEYDAAYDNERLEQLVALAFEQKTKDAKVPAEQISTRELEKSLQDSDWKVRYAALERMKPTMEQLPFITKALKDDNASIRRLATVYLGDLKEPEVLPYLFQALEDTSVSVRRTAGDCLSDIGDPAAIQPMVKALGDRNKIVRWRAARFLYEAGDESAIPALKDAQNDPEFEVSMQVNIALERIEGGEAAEGSVWQQMTRRN